MSLLSLYIPEQWDGADSTTPWQWLHDSGARGQSDDGQALPLAREVRLVLPAPAVISTVVALPRRGRWQDALPFALEDRVLSDVEQLHVAAGPEVQPGQTPVAAVAQPWLSAALQRARALGAAPTSAYSEAMLAQPRPGEWLLLVGSTEAVLVLPGQHTVALDSRPDQSPPAMLTLLLERTPAAERPAALRVRLRPDVPEPPALQYWSEVLGLPLLRGTPWQHDMPQSAGAAINLLQGRFAAVRGTGAGVTLALLRGPALQLLLASLVTWLLGTLIQTELWAREARSLRAQEEAALRRAFPETRTILDVPLQMQRGLDALRAQASGGGDLAQPLARIAAVADGLPARVQHLDLHDGSLRVDWRCPDEACANTLRMRLGESARGMELLTGTTDVTLVSARIAEHKP